MLSFLATKGKSLIEFSELDDKDKAEELAYEICSKQQKDYDPIYESAAATFDGKTGSTKFLKDVISILYRVGAIGVKLRPGGAFMYSHRDDPLIDPLMINESTRIQVHEMLQASMGSQNTRS